MPKIKINDISMYYEIHGSGEPVVFIGGFSADHNAWLEVLPYFKHDYQVILLDNRGAGQTDVPVRPYKIEEMANDVVEICAKLEIRQAHFIGNSMGGFIVQTLAFKYPHLVKSAVLSNTMSAAYTPFHFYLSAYLELLKSNAPLTSLYKASCSWLFSYQFLMKSGVLEQLIKLGLDNPYPFTIQGFEGQYAALQGFDSSTWLEKINVPTLVLASDQDIIFSKSSVKSLAARIPNASYYCFAKCGHLPQLEYPKTLSRVVKKFINEIG